MQESEHVRTDNEYKQGDILFAVFLLGWLESLTSIAITFPLLGFFLFFFFIIIIFLAVFGGLKFSGAGGKRA